MRICFCFTKFIILRRSHVFIAWYSPWHYALQLFSNLLAENWNADVPIHEYFGLSHALHLLLTVLWNSFSSWINDFLIISNSGRTIPTLTNSSPFPQFIGRNWKWGRADLVIFWIQPRAPTPPDVFSKTIFVAEIFLNK